MINLVLCGSGFVALHFKFQCITLSILRNQLDMGCTDHITGIFRDRQAAFPPHLIPIPVGNLGINQDLVTMIGYRLACLGTIKNDHPLELSDLRGRYTYCSRPILTRFLQVIDEGLQPGIKLGYRFGNLLKTFVRYF